MQWRPEPLDHPYIFIVALALWAPLWLLTRKLSHCIAPAGGTPIISLRSPHTEILKYRRACLTWETFRFEQPQKRKKLRAKDALGVRWAWIFSQTIVCERSACGLPECFWKYFHDW